MTHEERFVHGYVLDAHHGVFSEVYYLVYQQERRTVGQGGLYTVDVVYGLFVGVVFEFGLAGVGFHLFAYRLGEFGVAVVARTQGYDASLYTHPYKGHIA